MKHILTLLEIIKRNWFFLTIFTLLCITALSLCPLKNLPAVPGTDKTHHFIAYAILTFPTALRKPKKWYLFILFIIAYSGFIELVQPYVNRYGEWLDMAANTLGVIVGLFIGGLINHFNSSNK
jgi:VanZ family protein